MPFIRNSAPAEDPFRKILDGSPIPQGAPVLVPAARFLANAAEFHRRAAPMGVLWPNDRRVAELAPHIDRLALVALTFPNFRDGRAYSQARQLRELLGFRGELRATGEVLRDQLLFMLRAGFDSFELSKESDARAFAQTVARYSVFYQPAADGRTPAACARLAHSRLARAAA